VYTCIYNDVNLSLVISQSKVRDEEDGLKVIHIEYDWDVVEKLIEYFYYKAKWDKNPDERPRFEIDPLLALNLMVCAYEYDA
jgi:hypothetical protein